MPFQATLAIATAVLLAGLSAAQHGLEEPVQSAFEARTDLVLVPFQVGRSGRSASGLKQAEVLLFEDGTQRGFTVFEAPPQHPLLELILFFDLTEIGGGFWDPKNLHDLISHWNEATTQAILDTPDAAIRVSLYHFDQDRLLRLCRSSRDPKEILDALRRLPEPIPPGQAIDLALTPNAAVSDPEGLAKPWPLAGAIATLRDSAVDTAGTERALVIFSKGVDGTSTTPKDLADQAVAAGVSVYPVALPVGKAMSFIHMMRHSKAWEI